MLRSTLCFTIFWTSFCCCYNFELGYDHHYVYTADSDYLGMQNVTTTIKFHVHLVNDTNGEKLSALHMDSIVQYTPGGFFVDNPLKWDLHKRFLFRLSNDGVVILVHFHPDDQEETVLLKKVLSSTFSARVKISKEPEWNYKSTETDHLGRLSHNYKGKRMPDGIRLDRYHRSLERVERIHKKTLHYDSSGTIHRVEAEDNIILENRIHDDLETKRTPLEGEYVIQHTSEGDIGKIHAQAKVLMTLTNKMARTNPSTQHKDDHILQSDDIVYKKKENRTDISDVEEDLKATLNCIHRYEDKSDGNRTVCVNKFRDKLFQLKENQYLNYVASILKQNCTRNETLCKDERYLLIDIVSRAGDANSQRLTLTYVFYTGKHDVEELRRALFHFATLSEPIKEVVQTVEKLCFGKNDANHGIQNISVTERRACLTLGGLARTISTKNISESERLMGKIETWMQKQDHEYQRYKRETRHLANDDISDDHLISNVVLLHALGNAGLQRSLDHILNYTEPNTRESAWRRAAIGATRHYTCHKSAAALLKSMYFDKADSVRKVALNQYMKHPKKFNISKEKENIILSKNYTYPILMRAKREGFLESIDHVLFELRIEPIPEYHWGKTVGSSKVGASFGVDFLNRLHIRLKPFSGFLHLNIHDKVYAEAHVGIINYRVDILFIELCYRGRLEYNLNLLKDFTYGIAQDLQEAYDAIADEVVSPIGNAANQMKISIMPHSSSDGIFMPLTQIVELIPDSVDELIDTLAHLMSLLDRLSGLTSLNKFKSVVSKFKSSAEEMKQNAVHFYHEISSATLSGLPSMEKDLVDSINLVVEALKKIGGFPRQGFATVDMAKAKMFVAMSKLIKGIKVIDEALSGHPQWFDHSHLRTFANIIPVFYQFTNALTPAYLQERQLPESIVNDISQDVTKINNSVQKVASLPKQFMTVYQNSIKQFKELKKKFDFLNIVTSKVKTTVMTVFGPKFHKHFHAQRRICDSICGCGNWPTTTKGRFPKRPGIDVIVMKEENVISPLNGVVYRNPEKEDEIRIEPLPTDENFKDYDIIISNIQPFSDITEEGVFIEAGDPLGTGLGKQRCRDPFIHVAMRQMNRTNAQDPETNCNYVDPSVFVDNIELVPKWHQDCKEFTFRHINLVLEAGALAKGFKDLIKNFAKRAVEWAKAEAAQILPDFIPTSLIDGKIGKFVKLLKDTFKSAHDLAKTIKNGKYESGSMGIFNKVSDIISGGGEILSGLSKGLSEMGFPDEVTNVLLKIQSGSHDFSQLVDHVSESVENIASELQDGTQGISDISHLISSAVSEGALGEDLSQLLFDVGVSKNITDIRDKVKIATLGASNIISAVGNAAGDIAASFKNGEKFSGVMNGLSSLSSGINEVAGDLGNMLNGLGVSTEVTDIFKKIQKGATAVSDVSDVVGGIGSALKDIKSSFKNPNNFGNIMKGLTKVSSNIGKTVGHLSHFLKDVGVPAEVGNFLKKLEDGANDISSVMGTVGSLGDAFQGFSKGNDVQSIMHSLANITKSIGNTTGHLSHMLSTFGVSKDVTKVLEKIDQTTSLIADTVTHIGSIGKEISHEIRGMNGSSNVLKGISGVSSIISSSAGGVADILKQFGVKGETIDVLHKIKAGTDGAANILDDIDATFSNLQGSGMPTDGLAAIASGIGKTTGSLGHLLSDVGVSSDITDLLSDIEVGAGDASKLMSDIGSIGRNLVNDVSNTESINDAFNGFSSFSSGIGHAFGHVEHFMSSVGISKSSVRAVQNLQSVFSGASSISYDIGNIFSKNNSVKSILSGVGNTARDINHVLTGTGVTGEALDVLSKIQSGTVDVAQMISHLESSLDNVAKTVNDKPNALEVIGGFSALTSNLGSTVGDVSQFLQDMGVSGKAVSVLDSIHKETMKISSVARITNVAGSKITDGVSSDTGVADVFQEITNIASEIGSKSGQIGDLLRDIGISSDTIDAAAIISKGIEETVNTLTSFKVMSLSISPADAINISNFNVGFQDFALDIGNTALHLKKFLDEIGAPKQIKASLSKFKEGLTDSAALIRKIDKLGNSAMYTSPVTVIINSTSDILQIVQTIGNVANNLNSLLQNAGLSTSVTDVLRHVKEVTDIDSTNFEQMKQLSKSVFMKTSMAFDFPKVMQNIGGIMSSLASSTHSLSNVLKNFAISPNALSFLKYLESNANITSSLISLFTTEFIENRNFSQSKNLTGLMHHMTGMALSTWKSTGHVISLLRSIKAPADLTNTLKKLEKGIMDTSNLFINLSRTGRFAKAISLLKPDDLKLSNTLLLLNSATNVSDILQQLQSSSGVGVAMLRELSNEKENISSIMNNLGPYGTNVFKLLSSMKGSPQVKSKLLLAFGKGNLTNLLSSIREEENHIKETMIEDFQGHTEHRAKNVANKLFSDIDVSSLTVSQWQDSLQESSAFASGLDDIQQTIQDYINSSQSPSMQEISSLSIQNMGEFLDMYSITLNGDKTSLTATLHAIAGKECFEFKEAISDNSLCIPNEDCHGLKCRISAPFGLKSDVIVFSLQFLPEDLGVNIEVNNTLIKIHPSDEVKVIPVNIRILQGYDVQLKVLSKPHDFMRRLEISLSITACIESDALCLPDIEVFSQLKFYTMTRMKRSIKSSLFKKMGKRFNMDKLKKMKFKKFSSRAAGKNIKTKRLSKVASRLKKGIRDKLKKKPKGLKPFKKEFIKVKDSCDIGDDPEKFIDITIFRLDHTFGVGPIGIKLEFTAGGAIGMSIDVDVKSLSGYSKVVLSPWVAGQVSGGVSVNLAIASGGIKLIGYLLKTKFPVTTESKQAKKPIVVTMKIDLELIPIELQLRAWAKALFITFYDGCLWKWSAPSIKWTIMEKTKLGKDNVPPRFVNPCITSSAAPCSVYQIPGRHPSNPAFKLDANSVDDSSDLKTSYCIGYSKGDQSIQRWTAVKEMHGVYPTTSLPNGIPLYFTVKVRNSQGIESVTSCKLNTYDNTAPDGRIEASYAFSSHPNIISASLVVIDDSPLSSENVKALGYSPGPYGQEVRPWSKLDLLESTLRSGINSDLKYFSSPRDGKLTSQPMKIVKSSNEVNCASECVRFGRKCLSFDYEFHTENCELHEMIEGPFANLHISGSYKNYERIDTGYNSFIEYKNIPLEHGTRYYINVVITNSLKYRSVLSSKGTMVDFTPPEPGYLGKPQFDTIKADKCKAAITQRCKDVTWKPNHRMIIDGPDSRTVFNGHKIAEETLYTLSNHYISANFDGFHDDESGIWGYTWAAGTGLCKGDIVNYTDPHAHLSSKKYWTYTGYAKGVHLVDGLYYITVQALNNIVYGGALVTTVCHSTPIIVDTTPPVFYEVTDIMFDEDFDILAVYYNISDPLSKIARVDFGLGKTKHDVDIRGYDRHDHMTRIDPYFVVENLDLKPGVPAWIRVRAVNNVNLFASGHGKEPIMIDKSPPLVGDVYDGNKLDQDIQYQHQINKICGQWKNFFDPQSGIRRFTWGVGTEPLKDNIVPFRNISHYTKSACSEAKLVHNTTYFSTVIAFNDALNSKNSNGSSDGVLVDTTKPEIGFVKDGPSLKQDLQYSSESATIESVWDNFADPESGIAEYTLDVFINTELKKSFPVGIKTKFVDHTLSLDHLDRVFVKLHATNGAGLTVELPSDGFLVDHTPPYVMFLTDSKSSTGYQSYNNAIDLEWKFDDPESGLKEYRYLIQAFVGGQKIKAWPKTRSYETILLNKTSKLQIINITGITLINGAKYTAHVTAINKAMLSSSHESMGVVVDTTPPEITKIHIGHLEDDEELDDNGNILHDNPESLTVSWVARDSESGLESFYVAIGTSSGNDDVLSWKLNTYDNINSVFLENIKLKPTDESKNKYFVSLKMKNKAGLFSSIITSKPLIIIKANVPGVIFDGRELWKDSEYQYDTTSMGMSFSGFQSEACNIIGYDWAIGSKPYFSDILPFTDYGLVMENDSYGHAQIHLDFYNAEIYYITVRAKTGYGCRDEFIVSSSNGVVIDNKPPSIEMSFNENTIGANGKFVAFFQNNTNAVDLHWNAVDTSDITSSWVSVGSMPFGQNVYSMHKTEMNTFMPGDFKLNQGETVFVNVKSIDKSGLETTKYSPSITLDISPPTVINFSCTPIISNRKSLVSCDWITIKEYESVLKDIEIAISTQQMMFDLLNFTSIPFLSRSWSKDLKSVLKNYPNSTVLYVTLKLTNNIGLTSMLDFAVTIDKTPPVITSVSIVTTIRPDSDIVEKKCQIPKDFIEITVNGIKDTESPIERIDVGLGSKPGTTDIMKYKQADISNKVIFLNHLSLNAGTVVYATVLVYNTASLYATATSNPVVVSPNPVLTVYDGKGQIDEDYQSDLSMLYGHWKYSDPCPILSAEWAIEDLTGAQIKNFTKIPGNSNHFYNDELRLNNGYAYINIIRTIDALGRSHIARSDGISVRIQSPSPGHVIDGPFKTDLNYQKSLSELSCSWNTFGKEDKQQDPTQHIVKYEVAIGNDRRYEQTRSNVHYYINVGLNTSYTFDNLNLTAKTVIYYITVRAYSEAGSFIESTSNGIRVGYTDGIIPGIVDYNSVQSSVDTLDVSWSGFYSDYGIREYLIGIGSKQMVNSSITLDCSTIRNEIDNFDIYPPKSVGLNTFTEIENLNLFHGFSYYVSIFAYDETGFCVAIEGDAVTIDTTPPVMGMLQIGLVENNLPFIYSTEINTLAVSWNGIHDPESSITSYQVNLVTKEDCDSNEEPKIIASKMVKNETTITFYFIELETEKPYFIVLTAENEAALTNNITSKPIFIDTTKPVKGVVKAGFSWYKEQSVQSSIHQLHGIIGIARSERAYKCPQQLELPLKSFIPMRSDFSENCVEMKDSMIRIRLGHDDSLTKLEMGGVKINLQPLKEGKYSVTLKAMKGKDIVTSFGLASERSSFPVNIDWSDEKSLLGNSSSNINDTIDKQKLQPRDHSGIGVFILGEKQQMGEYPAIFWIRDRYKLISKRIFLPIDATEAFYTYDFVLSSRHEGEQTYWKAAFLVRNKLISELDNINFGALSDIFIFGFNRDDYYPPLLDPFHPFETYLKVKSVLLPHNKQDPCVYGLGFYDGESKIKEVWAALSNNINVTDNIADFTLVKDYCFSCTDLCSSQCKTTCPGTKEFDIIPVSFLNLNLSSASDAELNRDKTTNSKVSKQFENLVAPAYYIHINVLNFAGESVTAHSTAITIDTTAPHIKLIECVDPTNSMDEPVMFQKSTNSFGAFWECEEDVSQLTGYWIKVGTDDGLDNIVGEVFLGFKTKTKIEVQNETLISGETYFITLTAANSAGLNSSASCNITVDTKIPETNTSGPVSLFSKTVDEAPPRISVVESGNKIGVKWTSGKPEIEYYEWQIGSSEGKDDIFPRVRVGAKHSSAVAIIDGKMWFDGINTNSTLAEAVLKDWNKDEVEKAKSNDFFNIEPGRCMYISLFAITRSHVSKGIPVDPICIKRKDDIIKSFNDSTSLQLAMIGSRFVSVESKTKLPDLLTVNISGTEGGMIAGLLQENDVMSNYGTAASGQYRSFIVNPDTTMSSTSRLLQKRVVKYSGLSFYLSPTSKTTLKDWIDVELKFNKTDVLTEDNIPALLYWDTESGAWKHVEEDCATSVKIDYTSMTYYAKVCLPRSGTRTKRQTYKGYQVNDPRQFSFLIIRKSVYNSPPVVSTRLISMNEDNYTIYQLKWDDADGDAVAFGIAKQPTNGFANLSADGLLFYKPKLNFFGVDNVLVTVTEKLPPSLSTTPNQVNSSVDLMVANKNDAPAMYFLAASNETYNTKEYNKIEIQIETNKSKYHLGTFVAFDIDPNDTLHHVTFIGNISDVSFTLNDVLDIPYQIVNNKNITKTNIFMAKNLTIFFNSSANGKVDYGLLVYDQSRYYSKPAWLNIYFMQQPCIHGQCMINPIYNISCNDISRSKTFKYHKCSCEAGYEGYYCESDINECKKGPCPLMYDCIDLLADYACVINIAKLMAILVCIATASGLVGLIVYKKCQQKKRTAKVHDIWKPPLDPNPQEVTGTNDSSLTKHPQNIKNEDVDDTVSRPNPSTEDAGDGVNHQFIPQAGPSKPVLREPDLDMTLLKTFQDTMSNKLPPHHKPFRARRIMPEYQTKKY